MSRFTFPVGYHRLNKTKIIDFQLNRWYSFGYVRLEDMKEAGNNIKGLDDWKDEMVRQAKKAEKENRMMNAAFSYRAAEFFVLPTDPEKINLYDKFIELFYGKVISEENIRRILIPYEDSFLPAVHSSSKTNNLKGTIVIHGGFDSFMEEFYSMGEYFSEFGYEIILFEGPGQGGALKKYNLPLTYEWEKPVKAVLDYFNLNNVTLLGISMGGWLCLRAAAFESRIKRVIASSIAFDYMQIPPKPVADFARFIMKFPSLMNYLAELKTRFRAQEKWGVYNLMYITKKDTPLEASKAMLELNEENLHSELVKQDVLILTGAEDHFIPLKMHYKQVQALKNANSVTDIVFTKETQGHNHYQVGNFGLALETIKTWLDEYNS
ncbi:alpha/beta fold hydrolase [Serpentinicella alkaliphila]|uniref:Pimeloyl-ACP methyl ester carboxylesterase n=1 Tax=Serpentinicella alkaliphila TaxID=1734049 RepID=A0A4R2TF48_9FIRM|nr:alpha/beta fold hydrolase [Serpentinicella alkaliphila]QUH25500.1 alpha/beta fold hydrolase [Serpentinicella alkaliphila]TCP99684.1 pimeloyl-ACP methyl ester carboxylesterase [Serpentinicella alkaliphila]